MLQFSRNPFSRRHIMMLNQSTCESDCQSVFTAHFTLQVEFCNINPGFQDFSVIHWICSKLLKTREYFLSDNYIHWWFTIFDLAVWFSLICRNRFLVRILLAHTICTQARLVSRMIRRRFLENPVGFCDNRQDDSMSNMHDLCELNHEPGEKLPVMDSTGSEIGSTFCFSNRTLALGYRVEEWCLFCFILRRSNEINKISNVRVFS